MDLVLIQMDQFHIQKLSFFEDNLHFTPLTFKRYFPFMFKQTYTKIHTKWSLLLPILSKILMTKEILQKFLILNDSLFQVRSGRNQRF
jgi:hypothetical protein